MTKRKTDAELTAMREGGKILATIFEGLKTRITPGVTELELDAWVAKEITAYGATATYRTSEVNFPGAICISTNEQVVHSIPTNYVLRRGDVVGFDLVIEYKGMKTDSAFSVCVGEEPSGAKLRLLEGTEAALLAGIAAIPGPTTTGVISHAVEQVLTRARLGIVRELVGHGIGHSMHEPPDIPNYGKPRDGKKLNVGDTIAIEPMATLGSERIITELDGWTISTADKSLAAHFEHTVLITETGAEILTRI